MSPPRHSSHSGKSALGKKPLSEGRVPDDAANDTDDSAARFGSLSKGSEEIDRTGGSPDEVPGWADDVASIEARSATVIFKDTSVKNTVGINVALFESDSLLDEASPRVVFRHCRALSSEGSTITDAGGESR